VADRLVIIGSGMAAARLLESLDEQKAGFDITVIGEEPQSSYNRILLSSVLCGEKGPRELPLLSPEWYRARRINLITGQAVTSVDIEGRRVYTAHGHIIDYDRLVFATGSRAHIPQVSGIDADGVLAFRSLTDLDRIRELAASSKRVVVVGGGLLGLEAAHGLDSLGLQVTVVHRRGWPMNRQLDREAGQLLQSQLEVRGIRFAMNASPERLQASEGRVRGVVLDNGLELKAGMALFAAGIEPNSELAGDAGLECRRAIVVDRYLQTSVKHIYALGECCQIGERTFGLVAPVRQQADILAANLTGKPGEGYRHLDTPTRLKVSGIDLYSAGRHGAAANAEEQVLRDPGAGVYRRLFFDRDRLVGAILLGDCSGGRWYDELIKSRQAVGAQRPWLVFGPDYYLRG
jgi:nitrite reductase (NADH) large subunit